MASMEAALISPEKRLSWGSGWVPAWAYNADTVGVAKTITRNAGTGKGQHARGAAECVVGPALPLMFKLTLWTWFLFFVFPAVAYFSIASCPTRGLAEYPSWLLICFLPFILVSIGIEVKLMRHTLPPMVVMLGPLKAFGLFPVPFYIWFTVSVLCSVISSLDVMMIGFMFAKLLKTDTCAADEGADSFGVPRFWAKVMSESAIPVLSHVPLSAFVGLPWIFMLVQLVWAVRSVTPRPPQKWDCETQGSDVRCHTYGSNNRHRWECLETLAFLNRTAIITSVSDNYYVKSREGWCKQDIYVRLAYAVKTFLFFKVLECGFQFRAQASIFAVTVAANQGTPDYQALFSLCTSMASAFSSMWAAMQRVWTLRSLVYRSHAYTESTKITHGKTDRQVLFFAAIISIYFIIIVDGALLVFMSGFVCHGEWNLVAGCVLPS